MRSWHNENFYRSGFDTVATLASNALAEGEYRRYLTVGERERLASIRNENRKRKWLAGRMAGKYLYLNQLTGFNSKSAGDVAFIELTRDHLESFAPAMYQGIQILPAAGSAGGMPQLSVRGDGARNPPDISVSHTDDLSCACLTYGTIGIDLERAVCRLDSFYRGNFTRSETEWTKNISDGSDISPIWLYTVLWSLKESALKSRHSSEASTWDIPNIEIKVITEITDWGNLYSCETLGKEFLFFTVRIKEQSVIRYARIALTATRRLILVILKSEEAIQ